MPGPAIYQSTNDLVVESNSSVTKGLIKLGTPATPAMVADQTNATVGIGCTPTGGTLLQLKGTAPANIAVQRNTGAAAPGKDFTISAGAPKALETDQDGGTLVLQGGISTGSGESGIEFQVARPGAGGTTDRTPVLVLSILGEGINFAADPMAPRMIQAERVESTSDTGTFLQLEAGGAAEGATNKAGGDLVLSSGICTGDADSKIEFRVPTPGGSGTTDSTPAAVLTLDSVGLVFTGEANRSIEVGDSSAAVGGHLSITAGAGDGTDRAGGNLVLSSGVSTGTGASKVTVATSPAGSTSATPNTPAVALEIRGDGTVIAGRQAALLAQAATTGFFMIPAVATGAPSGTPASIPTGQTPITFSAVTGKLYVWDGTSAWKAFTPD